MGVVDNAITEWLTQFKAMQDAIAELKLYDWRADGPLYGHDLDVDLSTDLSPIHESEIIRTVSHSPEPVDSLQLHTPAERQQALQRLDQKHKNAPLQQAQSRGDQYPHVFKSHETGHTLAHSGRKYGLPLGSQRTEHELYEEYSIPASKVGTLGKGRKLVEINEMDSLCRETFEGYKSLNRMQSLVHPVAYGTNENMLICAPTGAGKTDVAMLAILNTISQFVSPKPSTVSSCFYSYDILIHYKETYHICKVFWDVR